MDEHLDSIWGHLGALRKTILQSLMVIGCVFVLLLTFYEPIFKVFTFPSESFEDLSKQKVQRFQIVNRSGYNQRIDLGAGWIVAELSPGVEKKENVFLLAPGQKLVYEEVNSSPLLILGPIEGLILVIKGCFWMSIVLSAPIWGWIWVRFILPGVKTHERALLIPFLFLSMLCIVLGILGAFFITLPLANSYLSHFNQTLGQNSWTLAQYVNYALLLCGGHGIAAEIALLLFIAVHFRLLSPEWLVAKRRYMIVAAFILGALLTPPDVLTQFLMAVPLIILYELAILYSKWRCRSVVIRDLHQSI